MQRSKLRSGRWQFFHGGVVQRGMNTTLELLHRTAGAAEHVGHSFDMPRFPRMAGAEQRYLLGRVSEMFHTSARDERQRLQRFERAASGGEVVRVTGRKKQAPCR